MTAETLRRAAALMRERAEATTPGPWHVSLTGQELRAPFPYYGFLLGTWAHPVDATHIASWHPAVALAVADLLDYLAPLADGPWGPDSTIDLAVRIAETYLGGHP